MLPLVLAPYLIEEKRTKFIYSFGLKLCLVAQHPEVAVNRTLTKRYYTNFPAFDFVTHRQSRHDSQSRPRHDGAFYRLCAIKTHIDVQRSWREIMSDQKIFKYAARTRVGFAQDPRFIQQSCDRNRFFPTMAAPG